MKIIEFTNDPMLQLEKFEDIENYVFNLNQSSMDEIMSYSVELNENIPQFFADKRSEFILLAEGGIDEDGNEFPDTYIGIRNTSNEEYPYIISDIYASDIQYTSPENGEEVFLKRSTKTIRR